jgi:hypothetical protein
MNTSDAKAVEYITHIAAERYVYKVLVVTYDWFSFQNKKGY